MSIVVYPPRGNGDCTIAATVNALCVPYEDVAEAFGYPVAFDGGPHTAPKGQGYLVYDIAPAIERLGRAAALVWNRQPKDAFLEALVGRTAVIATIDSDGEGHCLALRNGVLIDPRADDPFSPKPGTIIAAILVA